MDQPECTMDEIRKYYGSDVEKEWNRLERHRIEFAITMKALLEYLPPAPAQVLDIGGGPGRYALALTKLGYEVTLLDLAPENLVFAQQKAAEEHIQLAHTIEGNALDLSLFLAETFDAALMLGPLYHLFAKEQRLQAIQAAYRVLKPQSPFFAAFITRYAPLRDLANRNPRLFVEEHALWQEIFQTGIHRPLPSTGFTHAYFAHPSEIAPLMEEADFKTLTLIACEGIMARLEDKVNQLREDEWQLWVDINYQLAKDPSIHGAADHLLYIGQK